MVYIFFSHFAPLCKTPSSFPCASSSSALTAFAPRGDIFSLSHRDTGGLTAHHVMFQLKALLSNSLRQMLSTAKGLAHFYFSHIRKKKKKKFTSFRTREV